MRRASLHLRAVLAAMAVTAVVAGHPSVSRADGKDAGKGGTSSDERVRLGTQGVKPRKVIRLDEISVEGRIQKPQAFYILPRSSLNYSALDQQESFLPKIKKAVQKEPF
jgi:hypothetical protein